MNGDLRGFEPQEIQVMALVARYHRRGLPEALPRRITAISRERAGVP